MNSKRKEILKMKCGDLVFEIEKMIQNHVFKKKPFDYEKHEKLLNKIIKIERRLNKNKKHNRGEKLKFEFKYNKRRTQRGFKNLKELADNYEMKPNLNML